MLHLSPEKLYLLLWILFVLVRFLLLQHFLRSVLNTLSLRLTVSLSPISLALLISVVFSSSLSFAITLIFVCSSSLMICHAEIHLVQNRRKKSNSFERTNKRTSTQANPRKLNWTHFFMLHSNEMRGSEFHNFIFKRSTIDWIYCIFIEFTLAVANLWRRRCSATEICFEWLLGTRNFNYTRETL